MCGLDRPVTLPTPPHRCLGSTWARGFRGKKGSDEWVWPTLPVGAGGLIDPSQENFLPPTQVTWGQSLESLTGSHGRPLSIRWEAQAWSRSPASGTYFLLVPDCTPWAGASWLVWKPLAISPHRKPPRPGTAFSPKWPPSCWGPQTLGSQSRRGCCRGAARNEHTRTSCSRGASWEKRPAPETGQPSRPCTMVPPSCSLSPRGSSCHRPLSPASGSQLLSSVLMVLMPGGPPPHHTQYRSIATASASPSGSCHGASRGAAGG